MSSLAQDAEPRGARRVLYVLGFALLFWFLASLIGFVLFDVDSSANVVFAGLAVVAGGVFGWSRAEQRGRAIEAGLGDRRGRLIALLGVLLLHGFGALTWLVSLAFSADIGTDRQFDTAFAIGAVTWLMASGLIAWLWLSGRPSVWVPFAWWMPSFLLAIVVAYGW